MEGVLKGRVRCECGEEVGGRSEENCVRCLRGLRATANSFFSMQDRERSEEKAVDGVEDAGRGGVASFFQVSSRRGELRENELVSSIERRTGDKGAIALSLSRRRAGASEHAGDGGYKCSAREVEVKRWNQSL